MCREERLRQLLAMPSRTELTELVRPARCESVRSNLTLAG